VVGKPPCEELVTEVWKAITEPRQVQKLERQIETFKAAKHKLLRRVHKLEEEVEDLQLVKETAVLV